MKWIRAILDAFKVQPAPCRELSGVWTQEEREFVINAMFETVSLWAMVRPTDDPLMMGVDCGGAFNTWVDMGNLVRRAPAYQINARWHEIRARFGINAELKPLVMTMSKSVDQALLDLGDS